MRCALKAAAVRPMPRGTPRCRVTQGGCAPRRPAALRNAGIRPAGVPSSRARAAKRKAIPLPRECRSARQSVPLRRAGPSGRETTRRGHAAPPAAAAGRRYPLLPSRLGAARSTARPLTCAADFHSWSWAQPLGAAGSAAELSWAGPGPRSGCAGRRRRLPAPFRPQLGASSRPLPSPQAAAAAAAAAPPRAEVAWPPRSPDSRCRPPAEPPAAGSPTPARRTVRPSGEGRCFRGGREEAGPEVRERRRGECARLGGCRATALWAGKVAGAPP